MTLLCSKPSKASHLTQNKIPSPDRHMRGSPRSDLPSWTPSLPSSCPTWTHQACSLRGLCHFFCLESSCPPGCHVARSLPFLCSTVTFSVNFKKLCIRPWNLNNSAYRKQSGRTSSCGVQVQDDRLPTGALENFKADRLHPGRAPPPPSVS